MGILAWARHRVLQFSRPAKRLLVLTADVLVCLISTWIAFALRLDSWFYFVDSQWQVFPISTAIFLPIFIHYGLYRAIFRFTGWHVLLAIV